MAHWLQVHVEVPAAQVEDASATFERAGALSVTVGDAADDPVYEPLPGEVRVWRHNRVTGLFPEGFDPLPLRGALAAALGGGPGGWRVEALAERDWERAWLDGFRPLCFGTRLWVVPSTFEPPAPEAVNL
ncbi:MAG TPA: 50S ribosomal protein L11 methyltransferase, partial [Gammaproteobacteria bacterium]